MNILHMWKTDHLHGGGGAIAMHRLHTGLRAAGINSKILCVKKTTNSPYVIKYSANRILGRIEHRLKRFALKQGLNDIYLLNSFLLGQNPAFRKADIINIHGTHGFLNYLALPLFSMSKPIVYTLHDMWPYTGHCGFSFDCKRWKTGCGQCPYPENHPAIQKDNTRIEWKLKDWVYRASHLAVVTLSTMQTKEVGSSLLNRFPIHHIPNGLDTNVFQRIDADRSRSRLGLPSGKKVLMFAALSLDEPRKGGDLLIKALTSIPQALKSKMVLLTLGDGGGVIGEQAGIESKNLGSIYDDHQKAMAYSAADIFVLPSRAESFSLVVLESMACGTVAVAFRVGAVPDIIEHGVNGYVAESESAADLCKGIITLIKDKQLRTKMSRNARKVVLKEFTLEKQVERYFELYQDCLRSNTALGTYKSLPII